MDEYPNEEDEFELFYQDELEMLDDMPPQQENIDEFAPCTSKQALERLASQARTQNQNADMLANSPQISEISFGQSQSQILPLSGNGANRRLFSTPTVATKRICSTPLMHNQSEQPKEQPPKRLEVIDEHTQLSNVRSQDSLSSAQQQLQREGKSRKRNLERDLFGDIDDLYMHETYEDPVEKKARTEEEQDNELIEKIIALRREKSGATKTIRKDDIARMKAVYEFKMRNLSYTIPKYPYLPVQHISDNRCIYVRYHSKDYETRELNELNARASYGSLLGEQKQHIWNEAQAIVSRRLLECGAASESQATDVAIVPATAETTATTGLWVEKYKPHKYMDLLSDESTNRSLLFWLKMWDKVVFGKKFVYKDEQEYNGQLNSFNKRTGKFESTGGWKPRKNRPTLNTNVDEMGRPMQKVALLCGPPGLGKTTLAHTIARHAGYVVREINASDDRSPEAFKLALENGTQMTSVLNTERRPNCIILDEIDGAPRQSIEYLVKFVTDAASAKPRAKTTTKAKQNMLRRPIICICNDMYDPALRPLKLIAFVVNFPPIESARLAERLLQISRKEQLSTDFGALIALAEKSGNDVRSCISTMQFFSAQNQKLTLHDVLNNNLGQKDRHQGLFEVWGAIFRIQRPKRQLEARRVCSNGSNADSTSMMQVTMTNTSLQTRVHNVLEAVHAGGDYERLMQGVYENYLQQRMPDAYMRGVVECLQWFCFSDQLLQQINQLQNYSVYSYLQFGFAAWHLLFATLAWPKITFPTRGFEFNQKRKTVQNILQSFCKGISNKCVGAGRGNALLLDTIPTLKRIISPQMRSVAVQLLSQKEQQDLRHTIDVLVDMGLTFVQVKTAEGHYVFQTEPDLEALVSFTGMSGVTLPYYSRQLIAREVELERIRRAAPKADPNQQPHTANSSSSVKTKSPAALPNHLQTLRPKSITACNAKQPTTMLLKDFFGRVYERPAATTAQNEAARADALVKSPIWYRYKEGFNNAVRKDVHMNELL